MKNVLWIGFLAVAAWGQNAVQRQQTAGQFYNTTASKSYADSPYTVAATDSYIACDATNGAVVVNLPGATGTGREITIKKTDSSANSCTSTRAGSDTIDGATTASVTAQYSAIKLVDRASGIWSRAHVSQLAGDVIGASTANSLGSNFKIRAISFELGSPTASTALTTSDAAYVTVPFACAIAGYTINLNAADPSIVLKVMRVATGGTAIPTIGSNSISTNGWTVSSGTHLTSSTLTDLTSSAIAANDTLGVQVTTASTAKYANLVLQCNQ